MIIWRGLGILVVVIVVAVMFIFQDVVHAVSGDPLYYQKHAWLKGAGTLLSAVPVYFTGLFFNGKLNKPSDQEQNFRGFHSLFFIPMEYWGYILAVVGFILLFVHVD